MPYCIPITIKCNRAKQVCRSETIFDGHLVISELFDFNLTRSNWIS